jgi:hypothetical protein
MSSPDQFQIPNQPYVPAEVDVSLHASRLRPVEDANELNGARKDINDAFKQRSEELSPEARSYAIIRQASVNLVDVRQKMLEDTA